MSLRWTPETWMLKVSRAVNLRRTHTAQRPGLRPFPPPQTPPSSLHACQSLSHKVVCHSWKQNFQSSKHRGGRRGGWLHRASQLRHRLALLHTSAPRPNASSSSSRWAGLGQGMSRLRSTLDSMSKAVSGTRPHDLLSKIARLKLNAGKEAGKEAEAEAVGGPEVAAQAEGSAAAIPEPAPPTQTPTPIPPPPPPPPPPPAPTATSPFTSTLATASATAPGATPAPAPAPAPVTGTASTATPNVTPSNGTAPVPRGGEPREKKLRRVAPPLKTTGAPKVDQAKPKPLQTNVDQTKPPEAVSTSTAVSKQATPLFHPSSFSVNLDETYNYLAHHVNAYFGIGTKADEKIIADDKQNGRDHSSSPPSEPSDLISVSKSVAAVPAASSAKKGLIGHYLSYSYAPSVQAFVGHYITPLVPKFRAEPKSAAVENETLSPSAEGPVTKPAEAAVSKEQRADEERARRLLLQREKIIARVSVDNRTRALVQALHRASDVRVYINRVEDLSYHLMQFPETRGTAVKEKLIPCLLRLRQASDPALQGAVRQALALVGYHNPVRGRGVRVLSIDGGGTRGLVALQTLHKLEALTGKPIYQLFDYICGVSTGAILGFMLGVYQIPLDECDVLYRKLGSDVFKQNVIVGTMKMGWNHAFYDSEPWENILKEKMGSELMVETSRNPKVPKVAAVSTVVNRGTPLKAYVFRNYELAPGVRSHYLGGSQHQLWQALRASSAAPGYFQEFALGSDLHQDGGLLVNNPTALAIHECRCLWPDTPLECVVSLGTGRYETPGKNSATYTSLKTKLTNVISSATDTEEVHTMLDALLPPDTYYRFNPYMAEEIPLDESRGERLALLLAEGQRYLDRNQDKLGRAAGVLTREKGPLHRLADWARLRRDMYHGGKGFNYRL